MFIPLLLSIFLAINMGASGVAPSFSVAYGANAVRKGIMPLLFGIMVLRGALLFGTKTATTLKISRQ